MAVMFTKFSIQCELEYPFMLIGHLQANSIQWVVGFATIKFVVEQFGSIPIPLAVGLLMFVGSCAVFRTGMGTYESAGS